ncbi:puromycin-sensitive aminopeptidase-like [Ctenocephalides felis]|uniref:puromycin-sensitive aminopeptidase-like n=1 Tax=Ctenocephalides felis TaxID=7515 RepID=UPI000E6E4DB7|nr:puromycin-sensitive aminopeptidase-like [Ctenocephalides felis]
MEDERLPTNIVPKHYTLDLKPDFDLFIFSGKCLMTIEIVGCVNIIELNSVDLIFEYADLHYADAPCDTIPCKILMDPKKERVKFIFRDHLQKGKAVLQTLFVGVLNNNLSGFYRTTKRPGAATQFEMKKARWCFPCMDEPSYKTTFEVILTIPETVTALSNMPAKCQEVTPDGRVIAFHKTPKMSTYLLAIVIGQYEYLEQLNRDNVMIRVYTPVGLTSLADLAMEAAVKMLEFFEDYLGVKYPLPKLDIVTISDFRVGAMENWGLITCFAIFLQTYCCLELYPEYEWMSKFLNFVLVYGLAIDASPPDDLSLEQYTSDSMSTPLKGAVVLRMIKHQIGDQLFRQSANLFLHRFKYSTCETRDVWNVFDEVSGMAIGTLMDTWANRVGFPILTITSKMCNDTRVLTITQTKFMHDGSKDPNGDIWIYPSPFWRNRVQTSTIMDSESLTISLPGVGAGEWIKLNPGAVGFYRILYTPEELEKLKKAIKCQQLHALDRFNILNDVYANSRAGYMPMTQVMSFMESYIDEDEYTVWCCILNCLIKLWEMMTNTKLLEKFNTFALKIMNKIKPNVKWNLSFNESPQNKFMSNLILSSLVQFGDQESICEGHKRSMSKGHAKCNLISGHLVFMLP